MGCFLAFKPDVPKPDVRPPALRPNANRPIRTECPNCGAVKTAGTPCEYCGGCE